jgi:hypothetical protein
MSGMKRITITHISFDAKSLNSLLKTFTSAITISTIEAIDKIDHIINPAEGISSSIIVSV